MSNQTIVVVDVLSLSILKIVWQVILSVVQLKWNDSGASIWVNDTLHRSGAGDAGGGSGRHDFYLVDGVSLSKTSRPVIPNTAQMWFYDVDCGCDRNSRHHCYFRDSLLLNLFRGELRVAAVLVEAVGAAAVAIIDSTPKASTLILPSVLPTSVGTVAVVVSTEGYQSRPYRAETIFFHSCRLGRCHTVTNQQSRLANQSTKTATMGAVTAALLSHVDVDVGESESQSPHYR